MRLEKPAVFVFETIGLGKKRSAAAEFLVHQDAKTLAEIPDDEWIFGAVPLERPRPTICQCQYSLCGYVEHMIFIATLVPANVFVYVNLDSINFHRGIRGPNRLHPFSEKDAQERRAVGLPIKTVFGQFRVDIASVANELQHLEEYCFPGCLLPHQYRQIAEFNVGMSYLPDVSQAQFLNAHGIISFSHVLPDRVLRNEIETRPCPISSNGTVLVMHYWQRDRFHNHQFISYIRKSGSVELRG
jgi:hypothetical protein